MAALPQHERGAQGEPEVDYAQRGRDLLARVHLTSGDGAVVQPVERYSPVNAIWRHLSSGATLYVGNASTAASRDALAEINVTRIVFCQETDGRCHFENLPEFVYLKFPIGAWRRTLGFKPSVDEVWGYFRLLFDFVENELKSGRNVLIHCLAGAHRAGTAGVACLMHFCRLESKEAIPLAKSLRHAIDPIGSFPELLRLLDQAFAKHRPPEK